MRLRMGTNCAASIIVSLSFVSILASTLKADAINFSVPCPAPGIPPSAGLYSCVGTDGGSPISADMNLTVTSGGGTITESIQGSMSFTIPPGSTSVDLYTRQAIIPLPGNLLFGNNFGILVWADQPVSGSLIVGSGTCSTFTTSIGFGGGGDCSSSATVSPVPYLGSNPDLANAAVNAALVTGEATIAPGGTFSPGYWENEFTIEFSGGTAPTHINILFTKGSATLTSAELAPEPATAAELGIGLGVMLLIAYRRVAI
jgi:hypothetical protein